MSLLFNVPRHDRILLAILAVIFMAGQIVGAVLNLWGWPNQWF